MDIDYECGGLIRESVLLKVKVQTDYETERVYYLLFEDRVELIYGRSLLDLGLGRVHISEHFK